MTRTGQRRIYLLIIFVLLVTSYYVYGRGNIYQMDVEARSQQLSSLELRKKSSIKLSSALSKLDEFTINEKGITKLSILRHLGIENSNMTLSFGSRKSEKIAGTEMVTRSFTLIGRMPYAEALEQADWFYQSKKSVLGIIELRKTSGYGDIVEIEMEGVLYGLDKRR